jgi:hypothetical protein
VGGREPKLVILLAGKVYHPLLPPLPSIITSRPCKGSGLRLDLVGVSVIILMQDISAVEAHVLKGRGFREVFRDVLAFLLVAEPGFAPPLFGLLHDHGDISRHSLVLCGGVGKRGRSLQLQIWIVKLK